jgi:hypothetical protein
MADFQLPIASLLKTSKSAFGNQQSEIEEGSIDH